MFNLLPLKRAASTNTTVDAVFIGVICLWVAFVLFILRVHFLDDAFIHLRYAHNLLKYDRITYNGISPDFGTSSFGYTLMLSASSLIYNGAFLPKIVNLIVYFSVFIIAVLSFLKSVGAQKAMLAVSLILLSSPFGLRWTTDGMETGLVVVIAIAIAMISIDRKLPKWISVGVGAIAVLVRVEFLFVLSLAFAGRLALSSPVSLWFSRDKIQLWLGAAAPAIGGLIGLAIILLVFGHVLPDTAIAKRFSVTDTSVIGTFYSIAYTHISSSLLGVGLVILWIMSMAASANTVEERKRLSVVVVNSGIPVFFMLIAITNQPIQGIRYFIFIYTFVICWNVAITTCEWPALRIQWFVLFGAILGVWMAADIYMVYRISAGRSQTYRTFASSNLAALNGRPGIAWDIGFVGYFTEGTIWDVNGLVNGRENAMLSPKDRLIKYAQIPLDFAFANKEQLKALRDAGLAQNWVCILHADFPNASLKPDRHWLLVSPDFKNILLESTKISGERCIDAEL
jgi:hypothetical protein